MRAFASVALTLLLAIGLASAQKENPKKGEPVTHVDAAGAAKLLAAEKKEGKPVVLDIRTPAEYSEGHLKGATNIDFNGKNFEEELAKLDRDKAYVVHCRSGGRSGRSLATLKKLGFKKVYHLDGGIMAWEDAKLPIVK
jgi:rhodanese-related sulfurtransferase